MRVAFAFHIDQQEMSPYLPYFDKKYFNITSLFALNSLWINSNLKVIKKE